jgi:hypothetical protein
MSERQLSHKITRYSWDGKLNSIAAADFKNIPNN